MNTNRLMSRASVAVMAAFAPEGGTDTSKIGQPERVDEATPSADEGSDISSLSPEEQAQFDALARGTVPEDRGNVDNEPAGDADGDGDGDGDADGESGAAADAELGARPDGAADGAAADGEPRKPKTIGYGRHQRELAKVEERLTAALGDVTKEREARTRLDERTKLLLEAINTKAAPAAAAAAPVEDKDPEPDKEADPIGHLEWRNRKLEKVVTDLQSGRQQDEQRTAAQTEDQQLYGAYEGELTREASTDATFADAFVHLRESRYRELGFIYAGVDINDKAAVDAALTGAQQAQLSRQIQQSFHNEQMLVAREAFKAGTSPAKVVKNLALARGFAPKAAPTAAETAAAAAAAAGGNGKAPPAKPGAQAVVPAAAGSVTDQLKAIREGQDASRSLSDAGGSPGGGITPERLATMSDDEFAAFYDQMPKNKLDSLMGKPSAS